MYHPLRKYPPTPRNAVAPKMIAIIPALLPVPVPSFCAESDAYESGKAMSPSTVSPRISPDSPISGKAASVADSGEATSEFGDDVEVVFDGEGESEGLGDAVDFGVAVGFGVGVGVSGGEVGAVS